MGNHVKTSTTSESLLPELLSINLDMLSAILYDKTKDAGWKYGCSCLNTPLFVIVRFKSKHGIQNAKRRKLLFIEEQTGDSRRFYVTC
jgi:hypothetical protein